jgi:pyoverdine/dityrosine biosynthesis protein Dit1
MRAKKLIEMYENMQIGDIGKKVFGVVEYLVKENWSKDKESRKKSMQMLNEVCDADEANDFMEYLDEACTNYKGK